MGVIHGQAEPMPPFRHKVELHENPFLTQSFHHRVSREGTAAFRRQGNRVPFFLMLICGDCILT